MSRGFLPFITLMGVVAVIAATRGDWLLGGIFVVIGIAGLRLQTIAYRRRDR